MSITEKRSTIPRKRRKNKEITSCCDEIYKNGLNGHLKSSHQNHGNGPEKCKQQLSRQKFWFSSLVFAALAFLSFWPTLFNGLVFDDQPAIVNNLDVRPQITPVHRIFLNDFWGTNILKVWSVLTFISEYWTKQEENLEPKGSNPGSICAKNTSLNGVFLMKPLIKMRFIFSI